jgi:hypothetical protein
MILQRPCLVVERRNALHRSIDRFETSRGRSDISPRPAFDEGEVTADEVVDEKSSVRGNIAV